MSDPTPWTAHDPLVTVTITEPDTLQVAMFGIPYTLPPDLRPATRASFGKVMDHLYARLGQPFTVELVETDGTHQTGVIDLRPATPDTNDNVLPPKDPFPSSDPFPPAPQPRHMLTEATPLTKRMSGTPIQEVSWIRPLPDEPVPAPSTHPLDSESDTDPLCGGFWPGETVTMCLMVGVSTATGQGTVPACVPDWISGDVLLVGRASGMVHTIPRKAHP